ncbi:MAG TPA: radical SAM protein [Terriglobales bacterium]|nr:radical SAM protein [Terriglobales bacterium]
MASFTLELILPTWKAAKWEKGLRVPELTLPVLAALTPPGIDVILTEEEVEDVVYKSGVDLVAISYMTPMAARAYEIADEYRRRGAKVVLGGIHASALPEEAGRHADAIVIGEAEKIWASVLEDFRTGRMKGVYRAAAFSDLRGLPTPRRDLLKRAMTFSPYSIQTTRGCPFGCNFCSVTRFFGGSFRSRPVEEVVREIETTGKKTWLFIDDNIIGNEVYAKQLFRAIAPLGIRWAGQSTTLLSKNAELLDLAARSGCVGLFIGFESLNEQSMREANKGFNKVRDYEEGIRRFHDRGILLLASFMFGFDHDDTSVFERTVEFLIRNKVAAASLPVLVPYPGTNFYRRMEEEGRILTRDWSLYDCDHAVFRPKLMEPEVLEEGARRAIAECYSRSSILSRFAGNWRHPIIYAMVNASYRAKNREILSSAAGTSERGRGSSRP